MPKLPKEILEAINDYRDAIIDFEELKGVLLASKGEAISHEMGQAFSDTINFRKNLEKVISEYAQKSEI